MCVLGTEAVSEWGYICGNCKSFSKTFWSPVPVNFAALRPISMQLFGLHTAVIDTGGTARAAQHNAIHAGAVPTCMSRLTPDRLPGAAVWGMPSEGHELLRRPRGLHGAAVDGGGAAAVVCRRSAARAHHQRLPPGHGSILLRGASWWVEHPQACLSKLPPQLTSRDLASWR